MDRSNVIILCAAESTQDETYGQFTESYTEREVYCAISSVSGSEWFEAGRNGIKAELRVRMFKYDYKGETECIVGGQRYGVYRTYEGQGEYIDLYLERKAGVENEQQESIG